MSSEKTASAVNILKGDLASGWNLLEGSSADYTDLGIARRFGGSAAAYSLRDIGAMNGRVVKVRRDLAGEEADAEEDFSASQVQSGTLENWVNGKLENTLPADVATAAAAYSLRRVSEGSLHYTSDFSSDTDTIIANTSNLTLTGNIDGISDGTTSKDNVLKVENDATQTPQIAITNADYVASSDGIVEFTYYVPTGHPIIGSFWHIGTGSGIPNNYYTEDGVKIVGGTWTTAKLFFGSTHNGVDKPTTSGTGGRRMLTIANNIKASSVTETVQADDGDIYYISALTFKETIDNAVRIRRSSDDVEVNVAFDSDDKVSTSSDISVVSGSTTATDLNGFLNPTYTVGTSVESASRTFNSFTSNGNDGFTATKTGGGSSTGGFPYTFATGDVISVSFDLVIADSASPTFILSANSMGSGSIGTGTTFTSSGSYTQELTTSSGTGTHLAFTDGNTGTFTVSNFKVTSHKAEAFVHTWYDQAGSNNAVQTTAANQPKIAENGALLTTNGQPTLDFPNTSGTDTHRLETDFVGTNINSLSAYCVCKSDNTNTLGAASFSQPFTQGSYSSDERFFIAIDKDEANWHLGYGTGLTDLGTPVTTNQTLFSINAGTNVTSNINAVQESTASSQDNALTRSSSFIGGHTSTDAPWDGTISELIYYNSDQSNNRFKIESNINNYYGLYNDANEFASDETAFRFLGQRSGGTSTSSDLTKFTLDVQTASGYAGAKLLADVVSGDVIYVSFNASLDEGSATASPKVTLRNVDSTLSGTVYANEGVITEGFNSFALTSTNSDASGIVWSEGDDNVIFTISDIKVSRIERNGFVPTWYDQSTSGNNAVQATANDQPSIVLNGGLVKNSKGKPALDFVATADHLDVPTALDNINTASAFLVWERDVNSGNGAVAGQLGSSSSTSRFYTPLFTSSTMYFGYGNSSTKISMGSYDANRTYLTSFVTGDTNAEAFLDNVSKGTTAIQSASIDATNGSIGRHTRSSTSFTLDGQVSEVIYYKAKLQDDVADLNADINNHYNIY